MGRRCTAKAKSTGDQCKNAPIHGATVCKYHGAGAPQVKAAAARRVLEELVDPALVALRDIVNDRTILEAVRLAAAKDILDRTGYRPPTQVEVSTISVVEAEIARREAEQES